MCKDGSYASLMREMAEKFIGSVQGEKYSGFFFSFFFSSVQGFELRALYLLGRQSTT
jgi:hypothetical protein